MVGSKWLVSVHHILCKTSMLCGLNLTIYGFLLKLLQKNFENQESSSTLPIVIKLKCIKYCSIIIQNMMHYGSISHVAYYMLSSIDKRQIVVVVWQIFKAFVQRYISQLSINKWIHEGILDNSHAINCRCDPSLLSFSNSKILDKRKKKRSSLICFHEYNNVLYTWYMFISAVKHEGFAFGGIKLRSY